MINLFTNRTRHFWLKHPIKLAKTDIKQSWNIYMTSSSVPINNCNEDICSSVSIHHNAGAGPLIINIDTNMLDPFRFRRIWRLSRLTLIPGADTGHCSKTCEAVTYDHVNTRTAGLGCAKHSPEVATYWGWLVHAMGALHRKEAVHLHDHYPSLN